MTPRSAFVIAMEDVRAGLVEMASLALSQVERAIAAWEDADPSIAAEVIAGDDRVDDLCLKLDRQIYEIQLLQAPVAGDQRLLHVGLIAVIALERVGDLAVAISELASSIRPEEAVPQIQQLITRMSACAVDTLASSVQAIARSDVELAQRVVADARMVRRMLDDVLGVAGATHDTAETRSWLTSSVLIGRHLERVANNGGELAGRVPFLVDGRPYERGSR